MNHTLFIFILVSLVVIVAPAVFVGRKLREKTFILCYHKINDFKGGGLKSLFVRPAHFDFQMKYLKWRGYKAIPLVELARILKSAQPIPRKVFAITFDDGYKDNYLNAYPILKKYGFCATVFLVVNNIGEKCSYPGEPPEEHLSLEDIRNSSDVFDFGSHTLSHPDLSKLSADDIEDKKKLESEIIGSKNDLSRALSLSCRKIETFCYPFGRQTAAAVRLAGQNYDAACTTEAGLVSVGDDPYLLRRIEWKDLFTMSFRSFFKAWEFYLKIILGV